MRISRLHTLQPLAIGAQVALEPENCRRLSQVLRLKPGARICLFNGDGHDYSGRLLAIGKGECLIQIESQGTMEAPPVLDIGLALGISKSEHMDLAVQKAVELGVAHIQPLLSDFSNQKQSGNWQEKKHRHWQNIIISACEQSGRRRPPNLAAVIHSHAWIRQTARESLRLLLDPQADSSLCHLPPPKARQPLVLLVGPEGGLSPSELDAARDEGFQAVRLGPRILRTETAPLAAIAALQTLWGDFRHGQEKPMQPPPAEIRDKGLAD